MLKAEEIYVGNLFGDKYLFEIPNFQRPFSWRKDNFEQLFDDIKDEVQINKDRKGEKIKTYDRGIIKMNRLINALNVKLHKALRRDDTTFVSRTTLESTRYRPQKIVVLRAVLVNPLTDEEVLSEIVSTQNRIGLELWSEFKEAYKKFLEESAPLS